MKMETQTGQKDEDIIQKHIKTIRHGKLTIRLQKVSLILKKKEMKNFKNVGDWIIYDHIVLKKILKKEIVGNLQQCLRLP